MKWRARCRPTFDVYRAYFTQQGHLFEVRMTPPLPAPGSEDVIVELTADELLAGVHSDLCWCHGSGRTARGAPPQ